MPKYYARLGKHDAALHKPNKTNDTELTSRGIIKNRIRQSLCIVILIMFDTPGHIQEYQAFWKACTRI
jgi:hypothetical protein